MLNRVPNAVVRGGHLNQRPGRILSKMMKNNGVAVHSGWRKTILLHCFKSSLFNMGKVSDCSYLHPLELHRVPHRCCLCGASGIDKSCSDGRGKCDRVSRVIVTSFGCAAPRVVKTLRVCPELRSQVGIAEKGL